jgi:hypothetical protein
MKVSPKGDSTGMFELHHILFGNPLIVYDSRRGKSGGQVRDEYREEYDPGRGGYGRAYMDDRDRDMYA